MTTLIASPKRERRAHGATLLSEGPVHSALHVPLLLEKLETLLGGPRQAERTVDLV